MDIGISAVIATYNRKAQLKTLFESIVGNDIKNFEAIVVDQNTDGLINDIIAEFSNHFEIRHLKLQEPNQSKARNTGAAMAKYPIICFPDDDCWYDSDSLTGVLRFFEKNTFDTHLLIVNWQQHPTKVSRSTAITKEDLFSFRSVGYATIVLFFKTDAFLKLGGFLETIGIGKYIGGGEDSELTFRAASRGLNLYYEKDIKVNHLYHPIVKRDPGVIRSRQRAMGFLYALYDVPRWVVARGLIAPFIKMICAVNPDSRRQFYQMLRARIEGLRYGLRVKKNHYSF